MPSARVVAASGVMVAIAGCAALVVGMAAATMPKAAETVAPLPAASAAPTEAPAPTYPIRPVPTTTAPAFDTSLPAASRAVGKPPTRTAPSPAATHSRPAAPRQQAANPPRPAAVARAPAGSPFGGPAWPSAALGVHHRISHPGHHRGGPVNRKHDGDTAGLEPGPGRRMAALRRRGARARRHAGSDNCAEREPVGHADRQFRAHPGLRQSGRSRHAATVLPDGRCRLVGE